MNRYTLLLLTAGMLLSGCRSSQVRIAGRIVGTDAQTVYIEQVTPLRQTFIDSARLDPTGNYAFRLRGVQRAHTLYNLVCNGERIPLFLSGGDRVRVNTVGSIARNYTIEGSPESELLGEFYRPFITGIRRLDSIVSSSAVSAPGEQQRRMIERLYTAEYYRIKREQLKFIITNKSSLAAIYALYQRLPGDSYLFNPTSDAIYFRTVAEALEQSHPESPYLPSLLGEIARLEAQANLAANISVTGFPDLELSDMYGKRIRLSSLEGKVVLVDFWSASANGNVRNAELKPIYDRFAPHGFEVYQVAVETSKPAWIEAVQEQRLPWISVCDLRGDNSPALRIYNVRQLPANFLIDREGTVVDKDLYGERLEKRLNELIGS